MKTIVVAIDFSKGSTNALNHSKKLAKVMNAKITLVHSYSPPILDPNVPIGIIEETYRDTLKVLEDRLKCEIEKITSEGLFAAYKISFSDLSSVLDDVCSKEDVAFIVVGKTGYGGFMDQLLGSTANHLIDYVHAPLLVIPETFENEILSKVAYASQLEYDEEKYIEKAVNLAKFSPLGLHIVHIEDTTELNINADEPFLKSILHRFDADKIQIIQKESKNFKTGIAQFLAEQRISLITLTTHKRGLLGGILNPSKTKAIIKDTQIPVLIFSFDQ